MFCIYSILLISIPLQSGGLQEVYKHIHDLVGMNEGLWECLKIEDNINFNELAC